MYSMTFFCSPRDCICGISSLFTVSIIDDGYDDAEEDHIVFVDEMHGPETLHIENWVDWDRFLQKRRHCIASASFFTRLMEYILNFFRGETIIGFVYTGSICIKDTTIKTPACQITKLSLN